MTARDKKTNIKNYGHSFSKIGSKDLYKGIADSLSAYLFDVSGENEFVGKDINDYFCCITKNKNLYLSIGIFSIKKDETLGEAELEFSLSYPESQSIREKRKNGTFGACGHNNSISMINYIFSHNFVNNLSLVVINKQAELSIAELGFK